MAQAMLRVEDLTVEFDGFLAVAGVHLSVAPGALHFLIGPNGAGKTTLLDAVSGRVRPKRGAIWLEERFNVAGMEEHRIARLGIGRKFQTPSVFPTLTVRENLSLAAARPGLYSLVFGRPTRAEEERVEHVLALIGLQRHAHRPAHALSHGQKQWLEIGMVLVREPRLLLLDEPVAGMSRREREETVTLLRRIAGTHTILVVEHDMDFVRQAATRVTVLHEGKVLTEGSVQEVQGDPRVVECYLGRSGTRAMAH